MVYSVLNTAGAEWNESTLSFGAWKADQQAVHDAPLATLLYPQVSCCMSCMQACKLCALAGVVISTCIFMRTLVHLTWVLLVCKE